MRTIDQCAISDLPFASVPGKNAASCETTHMKMSSSYVQVHFHANQTYVLHVDSF